MFICISIYLEQYIKITERLQADTEEMIEEPHLMVSHVSCTFSKAPPHKWDMRVGQCSKRELIHFSKLSHQVEECFRILLDSVSV